MHAFDADAELGGGELRERRARAGADVLHADDDARSAVRERDLRFRGRPAATGGPVVRGEAESRALVAPFACRGDASDAAAQALGRGVGLVLALVARRVVA